ncbi:HAD domain-containing protein [Dactylosporangium sp. NPDC049525]|uniref:HAD domain-containing protein n=1 Tax=Dactylosporangium sp. NPDC049525 TaxID=3154730 RepID=UPI00341208E9
MRVRPILFLDVDGPLIPFGAPGHGAQGYGAPATARIRQAARGNPLLERLDPRHGPWLAALPCDLVWATTWGADANEVIAPLLDLPELPVVDWPDEDAAAGPVHWKTRGLVAWAAGRPFVWVDDEITAADREWVAAHHPGPALLHAVDRRCGLTREDVAAIAAWLTPP